MKIVKVHVTKFKILKDFEAILNGKNVLLLADNARGKSSFIQFIQIALGNQALVPEGAEGEGYVIADKEGRPWKFTLTFKKGKPHIVVESPEGVRDDSKSILSKVVGAMNFDVNEFVKYSETVAGRKKQVEQFKSFLPADVREFIEGMERKVKSHEMERTEKGRDLKTLQGYIAEHPFHKLLDAIPAEKVVVADMDAKIAEAMAHNDKVAQGKQRVSGLADQIAAVEDEIRALQEKLGLLKTSYQTGMTWLRDNTPTDISELLEAKDNAYRINAQIDTRNDFMKQKAMADALTDEVGELTALIESSRQAISDAIKDMDSPVKDLSFDDDNLLYKGVPVNDANLSTSEIMELGFDLKIAENPDLGVLFIERGESLGMDKLKALQEMADRKGLQIIMEQVVRGQDKLTIEIMEGGENAG